MAENREQRLKEITERLEAGVKEIFTSEQYTTYLKTMSKFHHYSFNNTLLITMQRPDATLVAGYRAWQNNFNRQVKKGEKGIQIISPAPIREKEEREKLDPENGQPILDADGRPETEEVVTVIPRFRVATVFDVAQTDGEPLPDLGVNELLGSVEGYEDFLKAIQAVSPVPIRFGEIAGESKGYYSLTEKEIVVKEGMSEQQTMKTLIHETTHAKLHDRDVLEAEGTTIDSMTREVQAESVAFTVCEHFGLDTSEYSFPYVASWSSNMEMKELRASMDVIRKTAGELIDGITEQMTLLQQEREQKAPIFEIYQIDPDGDGDDRRFMNLNYLETKGVSVEREHYLKVYEGKLEPGTTLEDLYYRFNMERPEDFTGHSLSVSDVVVIRQDGENKAYFVDSIGFSDVSEAFLQAEREPNDIAVEGHIGTWHTIDRQTIEGTEFFLMEHDEFGDEAANIIITKDGKLVAEDLWNGFDDDAKEAIQEYLSELAAEPVVSEESSKENPAERAYPPIYPETLDYAKEAGQGKEFWESKKENVHCMNAIEKSISDHFDGMHMDEAVLKDVLEEFGADRTQYVLASTIVDLSYDGRISADNKSWAKEILQQHETGIFIIEDRVAWRANSHPGLIDLATNIVRKELEKQVQIEEPTADAGLNWRVIHECDDEQGNPTEWATKLKDGSFLWIDKTDHGYTLTNDASPSIPPISEHHSLGGAKQAAEEYVSERNEYLSGDKIEIAGVECWTKEEWTETRSDGELLYRVGQSVEDPDFFYAEVRGSEVLGLNNTFEFDHSPTRDEVETDFINREAAAAIDQQEAEYGADGWRTFGGEPDIDPTISFYVAECEEFPVLGEYHENMTLEEAVEVFKQIPPDRMHGIPCIGFQLEDGSDYAGNFTLYAGSKIQTEMIDLVQHYKDSPLVQQAITDLQGMIDAGKLEMPVKEAAAVEQIPTVAVPEQQRPEEQSQTESKTRGSEPRNEKKQSVLQALRQRQQKMKQQEQGTTKSKTKSKGEQEL